MKNVLSVECPGRCLNASIECKQIKSPGDGKIAGLYPLKTQAIAWVRVKADKMDSATLAYLLRNDRSLWHMLRKSQWDWIERSYAAG